jgi:ADP-ribose pyrophosphatase
MPETTNSEPIYKGRVFNVTLDTIREDGVEYNREMVVHRGSAVIVPVFDDGTVALVRQYRHPAQEYLLEVPAGSLEEGEDPELGARRELEEEIGVTADKLEKIAEFYVSPGFLTEKMHIFLATGLTDVGQQLESDELIEIHRIPLVDAAQMALEGKFPDAKTIIGLTAAERKLRESVQAHR